MDDLTPDLTPKQKRRAEKFLKLLENGPVSISEHIFEVEESLEKITEKQAELEERQTIDPEEIVQEVLRRIPPPQDGKTPEVDYQAIIREVVAQIPNPKDGTDGVSKEVERVDYDLIYEMVMGTFEVPKDGKDGENGKDGSPDTPDQVVEKVNVSTKKIKKDKVEGLEDIERIARSNAMPVTTSFFNGYRAKNLNIIGGSASLSGDTVNVTVSSSSGSGDVTGPSSSTTDNIAFFADTTGKVIKDSGLTISGSNTGDETQVTIKSKLGVASSGVDGYLSGTDWDTFNSKQATGNYITALTGDVTASGPGSSAATLATVNSNVGSFGSATQAGTFTVNGKGLITAAGNTTITPAVGSITGLGTGVSTALGVNVGTAGAFVVNGGALGTPSSGVATNLTGTAAGLTAGNVTTNANLTGDVTSIGNATTLATVNSNTGSFGSSTSIPTFTVNAKGLITAASGNAVVAPAGTLTGSTLASGVTASSLTSLGTLTSATISGVLNLSGTNQIHQIAGHNLLQGDSTKTYFYGGTGGIQFRKSDNSAALVELSDTGNWSLLANSTMNSSSGTIGVNQTTFDVGGQVSFVGSILHKLAGHNFFQGDSTNTYLYGGTSGLHFRSADNSTALIDISNTGNLTFATDNTQDIGASGATRPRYLYFGTALIGPGTAASSGAIRLANQSYISGVNFVSGTTNRMIGMAGENNHISIDADGSGTIFGGSIRLNNNTAINARNAAGNAVVPMFKLDASNIITYGDTGSGGNLAGMTFNIGTGSFVYTNQNDSTFLVKLGGTTSSFPAIKRNSTALNFRLADDSADAPITAAGQTWSGNSIYATDNTYDLGASGATRPRTGYFGTSVIAPLVTTPSLTTSSGAMTVTPAAGSGLNVNLSTTGDFAVNTSQLYVDTSTANVGIGTTTPAAILHVKKDADANTHLIFENASTGTSARTGIIVTNTAGSETTQGFFGVGGTGYTVVSSWQDSLVINAGADLSGGLKVRSVTGGIGLYADGSTSNPNMFIDTSGNVGIGTTSQTAQLHTTGTVRFANFGAGTATFDASGNISSVSDERLKDIKGNVTSGLKELMNINPIVYKWNEKSGLETEHEYAGFSAQNVKANIPLGTGVTSEGYLTLQDRAILATVVNAVKELELKTRHL